MRLRVCTYYIKEEEKKSALFPLYGAGGGQMKWKKSVYRERERKSGASRLFFISSLFFSETISILRDELTTNASLSRSIGSLFLSSLRAEIEKEKRSAA